MIGRGGRVRVMDLGLARSSSKGELGASPRADALADLTRSTALLAVHMTQAGALMGTPAYMAPEQFLGLELDVRADIFAFCVTLWEALYGERPFAGETMAELRERVLEGVVRPPPRGRRVPGWLRRVCLRGLELEPRRRWPSMQALLDALARARRRARARGWVVGATAIATLGAGLEGSRRLERTRQVAACEAEGASISEVWSEQARATTREGLLAAGASYGAQTVSAVERIVDGYAEAWRRAGAEACLDTRVRGRWLEDRLARARWCLDERRMELAALLEAYADADATTAENAVLAATGLSRVDRCEDARWLDAMPPLPEDREGVAKIRERLSRVTALSLAGDYDEGLALALETTTAAEAIGWPSLIAAARGSAGGLLQRLGRFDEAEATLERAYFEAAKAGATQLSLELAVQLTDVVGTNEARTEDGARWAEHAEVALTQLGVGESELQRAPLLTKLARVRWSAGDYEEAKALSERALEIQTRALGADHFRVATTLGDYANVFTSTGEYEEARAMHERAHEIVERTLGPEHPLVASALNNLAVVAGFMGDVETAIATHERALAVQVEAFRPDHPEIATSHNNLSLVYRRAGQLEKAQASSERALELVKATHGPEHPYVAIALGNLASIHREKGEHARALELDERSLGVFEKTLGTEHEYFGIALMHIADDHVGLGELAAAKDALERSYDLVVARMGPESRKSATALRGLAEVSLAQERWRDAIDQAERAIKIFEGAKAAPHELAPAQFVLAQALTRAPRAAGRDPARARALARQARDALRDAPGTFPILDKIETFLEDHGPRGE